MTKRLTAQDWTDFALKMLAREGFDALKADVLARKLGVSRGSFYWHFTDLDDLHARVIDHWRQTATEAVIADLERYESREERLEVLLRRALGHHNALEMRMRAWADNNAKAAQAVRDMDRRRREYMERLLVDAGIAPTLAATRVQLLYWIYLGAALSQSRHTDDQLDRIVTEVKLIGFGGPPGATENPRGRSGRARMLQRHRQSTWPKQDEDCACRTSDGHLVALEQTPNWTHASPDDDENVDDH